VLNTVCGYAQEATPEMVSTPLLRNEKGEVLDNEKNRILLAAFDTALSSPGFDPFAIRALFTHASDHNYADKINAVMDAIRQRGDRVMLDSVDLSYLDLIDFHFEGASAKNANFTKGGVKFLSGADLSGANFSSTVMNEAQLEGATLVGSKFYSSSLNSANFNKANLSQVRMTSVCMGNVSAFGTTFDRVRFAETYVPDIRTDDETLRSLLKKSGQFASAFVYSTPATPVTPAAK
jgi:uncharacterized protein YjbI with pentapeptide repeats